MQIKPLLLSLLWALGLGACSPPQDGVAQEFHESSTSFDIENVRPFLIRVSGMIDSGFEEAEVDQVMDAVGSLALDQETELSFQIVHSGSAPKLRVTAFADDTDVADVAFFAPKALADAIDSEMEVFFDELGM